MEACRKDVQHAITQYRRQASIKRVAARGPQSERASELPTVLENVQDQLNELDGLQRRKDGTVARDKILERYPNGSVLIHADVFKPSADARLGIEVASAAAGRVAVASLSVDGSARYAGLCEGDWLHSINGVTCNDAAAAAAALRGSSGAVSLVAVRETTSLQTLVLALSLLEAKAARNNDIEGAVSAPPPSLESSSVWSQLSGWIGKKMSARVSGVNVGLGNETMRLGQRQRRPLTKREKLRAHNEALHRQRLAEVAECATTGEAAESVTKRVDRMGTSTPATADLPGKSVTPFSEPISPAGSPPAAVHGSHSGGDAGYAEEALAGPSSMPVTRSVASPSHGAMGKEGEEMRGVSRAPPRATSPALDTSTEAAGSLAELISHRLLPVMNAVRAFTQPPEGLPSEPSTPIVTEPSTRMSTMVFAPISMDPGLPSEPSAPIVTEPSTRMSTMVFAPISMDPAPLPVPAATRIEAKGVAQLAPVARQSAALTTGNRQAPCVASGRASREARPSSSSNDGALPGRAPMAMRLSGSSSGAGAGVHHGGHLLGRPVAAVVPPGQCAFDASWQCATLVKRTVVAHDVEMLTFQLPDAKRPLGLSTCACILARGGRDQDGHPVVRPYTPVSTNATLGSFELMVKMYPDGVLSRHLSQLAIGASVDFKHVPPNVKVQYPFGARRVVMIAGGSGITPMVQALHALLGTAGDGSRVQLLYSNKTQDDILVRQGLDDWAASFAGRLEVVHTLTREPPDSAWAGRRGRIDKKMLLALLPPPSESVLVFVCGPPAMYADLCGARGETQLTGSLKELGYRANQVVKF